MAFRFACLALLAAVAVSTVSASVQCGTCAQGNAGGVYSVPINCGPCPSALPTIPISGTTPTVTKPTIVRPAPCIPPPRTVCNRCQCTKTVVKPQPFQKVTTVPSVQHVISTGYRPVTETINYIAVPRCPSCTGYSGCANSCGGYGGYGAGIGGYGAGFGGYGAGIGGFGAGIGGGCGGYAGGYGF